MPPSTALTSKITLNHTPAMPGFFLVAIRYQEGGAERVRESQKAERC
nr:hypothetical protein [Leclercia sp.]